MANQPIVLASSSPYRAELLKRLKLGFTQDKPNVDETPHSGETVQELVARLGLEKARALAEKYPDALIIASDQAAALGAKILGKPGTHENAVEQLRNASGRTVSFYTSLCLLNTATQRYQLDTVVYSVTFRNLTDLQIENYLRSEQPYNCAGSFKSEGLGVALFASQQGEDPTALIGLPLIRLVSMLSEEGVEVI